MILKLRINTTSALKVTQSKYERNLFFPRKHSYDRMMETTKSFTILESTPSEYLIETSKTAYVMNFS